MTKAHQAKSTAAKLLTGAIPGVLIGGAICENLEAINELLAAVIATFS